MEGAVGDLVALEDYKPHLAGHAKCLQCGARWIGTAPAGDPWIECPECGSWKGLMVGPVMPPEGEERWQCDCGNELFYVGPDGVLCPACGVRQEFP